MGNDWDNEVINRKAHHYCQNRQDLMEEMRQWYEDVVDKVRESRVSRKKFEARGVRTMRIINRWKRVMREKLPPHGEEEELESNKQ